jgi:hypothetical protein
LVGASSRVPSPFQPEQRRSGRLLVFRHRGEPVTADHTVHHPPDTQACIFWLRNRRGRHWLEKAGRRGEMMRVACARRTEKE